MKVPVCPLIENVSPPSLTSCTIVNVRYVVGVGWDRCINIYCDEPNDTGLHQLVDPQERWEDDKVVLLV